jgi:hypothetical protein
VKFEVFTAVRMMLLFFWVLAPCRLVSEKTDISLHGAKTQKNNIISSVFSGKNCTSILHLFHVCYMSRLPHPSLFNHPSNITLRIQIIFMHVSEDSLWAERLTTSVDADAFPVAGPHHLAAVVPAPEAAE